MLTDEEYGVLWFKDTITTRPKLLSQRLDFPRRPRSTVDDHDSTWWNSMSSVSHRQG